MTDLDDVLYPRFAASLVTSSIVDLNNRQVTILPGSSQKSSPRWSPDGRYIAALSSPQNDRLPVFNLKVQRWTDLPVNGEVEFQRAPSEEALSIDVSPERSSNRIGNDMSALRLESRDLPTDESRGRLHDAGAFPSTQLVNT